MLCNFIKVYVGIIGKLSKWCFVNCDFLGSIEVNMFSLIVVFFYYLEGVRFVLYIFEEMKKFSVKKLINLEIFDVLLYLNFGGFYDLVFGLIDKDDLCGICF